MTGKELYETYARVVPHYFPDVAQYMRSWEEEVGVQGLWTAFASAIWNADAQGQDIYEAVASMNEPIRQKIYEMLYRAGHRIYT